VGIGDSDRLNKKSQRGFFEIGRWSLANKKTNGFSVSELNQDSVATVALTTEEANLLRSARWWESGQLDSDVILAVLTMIDRPDLVCPLEVYRTVLAEGLQANVSLQEIRTSEGRAQFRQRCLAKLEPKVQEELRWWVDIFLEQAMANITTVRSKLKTPPVGGIGWHKLRSRPAKKVRDAIDPQKFTPEALAARQLLTNNRIISTTVFQEGLDVLCKTLGLPPISALRYGFGGDQQGSPKNRIQLGVDLLAAQKPETLLRLQQFFPIEASSEAIIPNRSAPSQRSSLLPRIESIRLNGNDFVLMPKVAETFGGLLSKEHEGDSIRPVYILRPERQEEIRERAPSSVIDLTGIPEEWLTWWEGLDCHGITTKGGLCLIGESRFRELTAEITLAQILVASHQCAVTGQLFCNAIVSRPVGIVPLDNIGPHARTILFRSYSELLPYCKDKTVLNDLIQGGRSLHDFVVGAGRAVIYEAAPGWASRLTVADGSRVIAELAVMARIEGPGASYVKKLVGATSVGEGVYCVESVDQSGRERQLPGQKPLITKAEWLRNLYEATETILFASSEGMSPSAEIESEKKEGRFARIRNALRNRRN
jgi:hypothetical protein